MSFFPAIAPTSRVYTLGDLPAAKQQSLSGAQSSFRRGNRRVGQTLELSFAYLTETQVNLIKAHYFDRRGSFDIFFLSAEIWGDYTTPPVPIISDTAWRYASEPEITDVSYDRFSVDLQLQTIPIDTGDLDIDSLDASASAVAAFILEGGTAALPAEEYIVSPTGAS